MPVERAGAQVSAVEDRRDAQSLNPLFANGFGCCGHDCAAHIGVGWELFVALSRAWSGHAVAS